MKQLKEENDKILQDLYKAHKELGIEVFLG